MKLKRFCAAAMCLLLVTLCGCNNQINMNERMLIQGIGVDRAGDEFNVALQVSGVREGGDGKPRLVEARGESVMDAVNNATLKLGKRPLYSHNMVLLVGRELAEESLFLVTDLFVRWQETRPTLSVFMAEGEAGEMLRHEQGGEVLRAKDIADLARAGVWNGKAVETNVLGLFNTLYDAGAAACLPVLALREGVAELSGTALFTGGRLADVLGSDLTRGLLLAMGRLKGGAAVVEMPGVGRVTLNLVSAKSKVTASLAGGVPRFEVELSCAAGIAAIDSENETMLDASYYEKFSQALGRQLKEQTEAALERCAARGSDAPRLERRLLHQDTEAWRSRREGWPAALKMASFKVSAKVEIERVGQEISPMI